MAEEVTREDRDAALWMGRNVLKWTPGQINKTEAGDGDNASLVQAFARHRRESTTALQAKLAAAEKMAEALDKISGEHFHYAPTGSTEPRYMAYERIARQALTEWKDSNHG